MAAFGETLRREREMRGVSLREVADATKISVRFLQAIETDRLDVLPGGLFPRAFVRQYAAHLGLDAERAVADFVRVHGGEIPPPSAAPARSGRPLPRKPLAAAAALGLALVAFVVWRAEHAASRSSREPDGAPALPSPSVSADRVYPPPLAATAAAGVLALDLVARENCWVSVKVDGVKVLDRVLGAGERESLRAERELVLSVGNAGGIEITLNGRAGMALGRPGEVRRNIVITPESLPTLLRAEPTPPPAARRGAEDGVLRLGHARGLPPSR
jgi:transcriptional regulator with XRE-family HTH domain